MMKATRGTIVCLFLIGSWLILEYMHSGISQSYSHRITDLKSLHNQNRQLVQKLDRQSKQKISQIRVLDIDVQGLLKHLNTLIDQPAADTHYAFSLLTTIDHYHQINAEVYEAITLKLNFSVPDQITLYSFETRLRAQLAESLTLTECFVTYGDIVKGHCNWVVFLKPHSINIEPEQRDKRT